MSRIRPFRNRGAPVVDDILQAVLVELAQVGPEGLRVERVAEVAHVSRSTIYRRWPTRDGLIADALSTSLRRFADLPDEGSLERDLLGFAHGVAATIERPEGLAVIRTIMSSSGSDLAHRVASSAVAQASEATGAAIAERARSRGEWGDADPNLVFFTIVGAIYHRKLLAHAPIDDTWLRALITLITQGLAPRA